MSRYIDADALIESMRGEFFDSVEEWTAIRKIDEAPSIDIVRCGECKFWAGHSIGNLDDWEECRWREDEATDANDFCSYGEVRDE